MVLLLAAIALSLLAYATRWEYLDVEVSFVNGLDTANFTQVCRAHRYTDKVECGRLVNRSSGEAVGPYGAIEFPD
jgi:hypothetical protein